MAIEILVKHLTPRQEAEIVRSLINSGVYRVDKKGHVDLKKAGPDFPRTHGHPACIGLVGDYNGDKVVAITNKERVNSRYTERLIQICSEYLN